MSEADGPKNAIFAILDQELEKLEKSAFDSTDQNILVAREKMLDAVISMGFARYNLGLAVSDYRTIYEKSGEGEWRDNAGEKIANVLGYSSLKSIDNLIDDAELADQIGHELRNAMVARGYDPAASKNRDIVTSLTKKQQWPQTLSDALEMVDEEIARRSKSNAGQRAGKGDEPQQRPERPISQLVNLVNENPSKVGQNKIAEAFGQVDTASQVDQTKPVGGVDNQHGAAGVAADAGRVKSPDLIEVLKSAESDTQNPLSPASIPSEIFGEPIPGPTYLHPWGDVCLNTLRILNPGSNGCRQVEFNRKLLYGVRENREPTRYLVGGLLDLFDPGVPQECFDEHLNVFFEADWHTFLVLTPHVDSVQRHWRRRKEMTSGLSFPVSLWTGAAIDRADHLERMRILHETGMTTPWASFVGYRSDQSHPLSNSSLLSDIYKFAPRLVVFGWEFAGSRSDLSIEDARTLAGAAARPEFCGTRFFFTHPESRHAFLNGSPLPTVSSSATRSVLDAEQADELLAWAEQIQNLPDDWFRQPFPPTDQRFDEFEGAPVELFDYLP